MLRWILFIVVNGLLGSVQALAASHGVILQYHHIATNTPESTSLRPDLFRRQMAFLRDHGFQVWPLSRLVEALQSEHPLPDGVVAITFDDAYDDIYTTAAPILKQFGFSFTVFVSTEYVQRRQRGYMTWDDLRALQKQGGSLANHSHSHTHLLRQIAGESNLQWQKRVTNEIEQAQTLLEQETATTHRYFAWPYGEYSESLVKLIQQMGYLGFGQQSGAVSKAHLQSGIIPRFPINNHYADMEEFQYKVSSIPLPIHSLKESGVVWEKAGIPLLELALPQSITQLTCYATGQGRIQVLRNGAGFQVLANRDIPVGRSRYNCTAPYLERDEVSVLDLKPRFYWYSHLWIRKQDDGSWYPEP